MIIGPIPWSPAQSPCRAEKDYSSGVLRWSRTAIYAVARYLARFPRSYIAAYWPLRSQWCVTLQQHILSGTPDMTKALLSQTILEMRKIIRRNQMYRGRGALPSCSDDR